MGARRRIALGLSVAGLPVVLGAGARVLAVRAAEQGLAERGVTWEDAAHGLVESRFSDLSRGPVHVDTATLRLLPAPAVHLQGVEVQLKGAGEAPSGGSAGTGVPEGGQPVPVTVEGVSLRFGEEVLAEELSGTLAPVLALSGEGLELRRDAGAWEAHVSRSVTLDAVSGQLSLEVQTRGEVLSWSAEIPDLVLDHPLLASKSLPPAALSLTGTWRREDGALDARGSLGGLDLALQGTVQPAPRSAELTLEVDGPLAAVLALFGDRVPEGARADCQGTVGLSATLSLPDRTWSAHPRAEGLACSGVLADVDSLKDGAVTWRTTDAEGIPTVRRTGPGLPGWTSWQEGRRVAEVFMASEDIGFPTHPGYDLGAIQEALDEAAAGDPRPRGGSTLTQQLAKNLFLSGERTLARKLRELVYALALEQALDKRHILQLYLNVVELGPDVYGIGAAADRYFAKRPAGLTDAEAAFLATLLPSPVKGHDRAVAGRLPQARMAAILDNLALSGMRTRAQADVARRSTVIVLPPPE